MNATLRLATRHDMPGLWRVRLAVTENRLTPGRIGDEDCRREIEDTGRGWVAEVDGQVQGFAIANGVTGNLWALFVHPEAQGQGLGERLHSACLAWWADQPTPRLWLNTGADTRALAFYLHRGWQLAAIDGDELRLERPNRPRPAQAAAGDSAAPGAGAWAAPGVVASTAPGAGATVAVQHPPVAADLAQVDAGIGTFNQGEPSLRDVAPLAVLARDGQGQVCGGAVGRSWGHCVELQQLWVAEALRHQGLGSGLLQAFEAEARARGCRLAYLETFSFQAPGFYARHGWRTALITRGYSAGVEKHTLQKLLGSAAADGAGSHGHLARPPQT